MTFLYVFTIMNSYKRDKYYEVTWYSKYSSLGDADNFCHRKFYNLCDALAYFNFLDSSSRPAIFKLKDEPAVSVDLESLKCPF